MSPTSGVYRKMMSERRHLSKGKAKKILRHGEVKGKPLTKKQKGLFGLIAGGKTPSRLRKTKKRKMMTDGGYMKT